MFRALMIASRIRYGLARICWRCADRAERIGARLLAWARVHEAAGVRLWSRAMEARKRSRRQP